MIHPVYNFDNFWEGRASFIFNGVNRFDFRDRLSTFMRAENGKLSEVYLRVTNSSLASQAVGPATSNLGMLVGTAPSRMSARRCSVSIRSPSSSFIPRTVCSGR